MAKGGSMRRPRMTIRMADAIIGAAQLSIAEMENFVNVGNDHCVKQDRDELRLYEDLARWSFRNRDWLEWRAKQREEA